MNSKKIHLMFFIYCILVFIILFSFYSIIDSISIFDTDDWSHSYILRIPVPIIRAWNPTRVFPEVFEPLVAYFGAYVVYPITGNYTLSLSIVHSLFVSLILMVYFYEFVLLIYTKVSHSVKNSIFTGFLFLIIHFVIFLHPWRYNTTLLHSWDLSCLYYYTASTALNAALVMHIVSHGGIDAIINYSIPHKILLILWCYFSIFSNLYSSIVLASFAGAETVIRFTRKIAQKQFSIKSFVIENKIHFLILGIWMLSHIIEKTGGRSGSRAGNIPENIVKTFQNLISVILSLNVFFSIFAIVVVILWLLKCEKKKKQIIKMALCFFLTIAYLYLLCVVVDSLYITRSDVIIAFAFWVLVALMSCFAQLLSVKSCYGLAAIILFGSIAMFVTGHGKMFIPMNYGNLQYEQCEAIIEDIIAQFKLAEESGQDEIDLVVPQFDSENNWPISASEYACERYQEVIYRHHLVSRRIRVKSVIPSQEKAEKFLH